MIQIMITTQPFAMKVPIDHEAIGGTGPSPTWSNV